MRDYVGNTWRLAVVTEGGHSTPIPAGIGASLQLRPDGRIHACDGVNRMGGKCSVSADGFEVRAVATTLAGYFGDDPQRLAAIAALSALVTTGTPSEPACVMVLRVDATTLIVQAGRYRLTFERDGSADTREDPPASPALN